MTTLIPLSVLAAAILYTAAGILYLAGRKRKSILRAGCAAGVAGLLANAAALVARGLLLGRLPLSDGGDFILIFALLVAVFYFLFERASGNRAAGPFALLCCAALVAEVALFQGDQLVRSRPLSPSLKSPLLSVHVITAAVSYAGFALAGGLAAARLKKLPCDADGKWSQRIVMASFALLTLTIVLGAFWAEVAWGTYWSWDPKETWALITWLIYAVYLHRRKAWKGRKADVMLILGFLLVIFTFFGVNYLFAGMHSYA